MRWIILAAVATLVMPATAAAQTSAAAGCAHGQLVRVRLVKVKPGGSMAGLRDAVAAHTRWYQTHGFRIEQEIAPVLVTGKGKPQALPDEVMTFATGDDVPRGKHDAEWAAFVAKYRANSEIEKEAIVCMAKPGQPAGLAG